MDTELTLPWLPTHKMTSVVAIDVGTTYSGYAFSNTRSAGNITLNSRWGSEYGVIQYQTPTCVLTDDNNEFIAFGYDARKRYADDPSNPHKYQLYDQFKMQLDREKLLETTTQIKSRNNRVLQVGPIIEMSLDYLSKHALEFVYNSHDRDQFQECKRELEGCDRERNRSKYYGGHMVFFSRPDMLRSKGTSTRLSALHANVQNATFENGAMNINSRGHLETANEAQADVEKGHAKQTQKLHIVTKFERDETYKTQEMKKRTPKRDFKSSSLGTIVGLGIYLVPYLVTLMLLCQPALTLAKPGGYNHGDTNTKTCRPTLSDSTHTEVDFRQLECEISACDKLSKIMFEKTGVESATTWNRVFVGVDKTHYQAIDTGYGYTLQNRSDYHAFPTKHLLYINPLTVEDEGKWRCVVYDDSYRVFTSDAMTLSQTDTQLNQTDGVDQKTYIKEQLYKDGFVVAMFGSTLFGMALVVLLAGVLLILKQRDAKGMQNDKHYGGTPQTRISDKSQALLG